MKSYTILIIDSSLVDFKIMKKVLLTNNTELLVISNQNGHNYLEQIREFNVQVIVLDLMLETLAVDVLRTLKSSPETEKLPVILSSTPLQQKYVSECFALGAYDYIEKPFTDLELHHLFYKRVSNALNYKLGEEAVEYLSTYDTISGLMTRKYIEKIYSEFNKRHGISVLLLDVNSLKMINDAYGAEIGDAVLSEIGEFIKLYKSFYISAARWGSDELFY